MLVAAIFIIRFNTKLISRFQPVINWDYHSPPLHLIFHSTHVSLIFPINDCNVIDIGLYLSPSSLNFWKLLFLLVLKRWKKSIIRPLLKYFFFLEVKKYIEKIAKNAKTWSWVKENVVKLIYFLHSSEYRNNEGNIFNLLTSVLRGWNLTKILGWMKLNSLLLLMKYY